MSTQLTSHIIAVHSSSRDQTAYPNAGDYQIALPQRYRNVWSAQLLNIEIPELTPPQRNIYLDIEKLSTIDSVAPGAGVNFAIAKIPLVLAVSNVFYVDALTSSFMVNYMQNPIASMDRFNVRLLDSKGNVLTLSNAHSFQIQLMCGDYITSGGGSTITHNGRIMGGTR
jgi:hypothetical protein